jgi:hypothetical protein
LEEEKEGERKERNEGGDLKKGRRREGKECKKERTEEKLR